MIACRHLAPRRGGEKAVRWSVPLAQLHPAPRQRGGGTIQARQARRMVGGAWASTQRTKINAPATATIRQAGRPFHHAEPVIGPATSGRTRSHGPPPPFAWGRTKKFVPAARFLSGAAGFQILAPRLSVSIEELWLLPFAPWNREKGSGTPVDADPYPPHPAVRLCLRLGKQLACRRSTRGSRQRDSRPQGSASGHVSCDLAGAFGPESPPQPGGGDLAPLHGRYPRRPVPVQ